MNYLAQVKEQYEHLPYPPVDPNDETLRLQVTWLDQLEMMNHYCFQGKQTFDDNFRVLVAGGGTGDATIFLAEQLRLTNASVVHLDLSKASIDIAKERAAIRCLNNIEWVQDSLLNVESLGLGKFDYINCCGVLHHLSDPDAGLCALKSVLADGGALGVMVYGAVGRTGIYHLQQMLWTLNRDELQSEKLAFAKQLLAILPKTNWFKRGESLYADHHNGDAGIFDMLLHSQDRACTIKELFAWLDDQHGYHIILSDVERGRFPYLPALMMGVDAQPLCSRTATLPLQAQYAIGELLRGDLITHSFYLTSNAMTTASYGDIECIPFFFYEPISGATLEPVLTSKDGKAITVHHAHLGLTAQVNVGPYSGAIVRYINGKRTFGQIFDLVRADHTLCGNEPDNTTLFADFAEAYNILNSIERLLLRHVSTVI